MEQLARRQLILFPWLLLAWLSFLWCAAANGQNIKDPIAHYLAMKVPDRVENTGGLLVIKRVDVDIDGDGTPEVFVGTWYR
jgi:hypothetical protein